ILLTSFKKDYLALIEVDEVLGFMGEVTTKVPPNNVVPGGVEFLLHYFLIAIFLNMGHNALFYIIFLQCLRSIPHRVLFHLLQHIEQGLAYAYNELRNTLPFYSGRCFKDWN
uniref:Dynein light chain n=1 Tax=Felis catus TaxID=9685 RepID=A0ABI7YIE9_FELCA